MIEKKYRLISKLKNVEYFEELPCYDCNISKCYQIDNITNCDKINEFLYKTNFFGLTRWHREKQLIVKGIHVKLLRITGMTIK